MSASLYWEVIPEEPKANNVGWLKRIFEEKYGDDLEEYIILNDTDIPFLEGIKFAGDKDTSKDASKVIAAIQKYKQIKIYKSY